MARLDSGRRDARAREKYRAGEANVDARRHWATVTGLDVGAGRRMNEHQPRRTALHESVRTKAKVQTSSMLKPWTVDRAQTPDRTLR